QAEDGIRDKLVTGVQTCALPICYGKLTPLEDYPSHSRGGQGVYTMAITDRTGPLVGMRVVVNPEEEQLIVISEGGQVIRTPIENIRVAGRQTQGVIIMRLDECDTVATIAGVGGAEEAEA